MTSRSPCPSGRRSHRGLRPPFRASRSLGPTQLPPKRHDLQPKLRRIPLTAPGRRCTSRPSRLGLGSARGYRPLGPSRRARASAGPAARSSDGNDVPPTDTPRGRGRRRGAPKGTEESWNSKLEPPKNLPSGCSGGSGRVGARSGAPAGWDVPDAEHRGIEPPARKPRRRVRLDGSRPLTDRKRKT